MAVLAHYFPHLLSAATFHLHQWGGSFWLLTILYARTKLGDDYAVGWFVPGLRRMRGLLRGKAWIRDAIWQFTFDTTVA